MTNTKNSRTGHAVTMKEIASRCGVTQATVSRALNNDPHVHVDTAARIRQVAADLGYDIASQQYARRLVQRRYGNQPLNQLIAVFCPKYFQHGHYYPPMLDGIYEATTMAEFGVCVGTFDFTTTDRFPLQTIVSRGDVDGIILLKGSYFSSADLDVLRKTPGFGNRPIVSLLDTHEGCSTVTFDQEQLVRLGIHHLLELGHRHILHFSYPDAHGGKDWGRIRIAYRVMAEAGLPPEEYLHVLPIQMKPDWGNPQLPQVNGQYSDLHGEFLLDYLHEHPEVTAIIGVNDASALYAAFTMRQAGIRIPEDISIVGSDDTDSMCDEFGRNLLTSVHVPLIDIGREGTHLLLRRASGELSQDVQLVVPVELVVRKTTARPRTTP